MYGFHMTRQGYSYTVGGPGGHRPTHFGASPPRSRMCRSWAGVVTWSAVVRPIGHTAKYSKTTLESACDREINIQFSGNSSGGHSCSQHANCTFPKHLRHLWHCVVWPFILPNKGETLTNRDVNKFVHKM